MNNIKKPSRRRLSPIERENIHQKTKGRCAYCGCDIKLNEMQIDHMIPFLHGGSDCETNLWAACRSCNHRKGTSSVESFREQVQNFLKVLERDSVTYRNAVRFRLVIPNPVAVIFYFEEMEVQTNETNI